jgi:hypothetical protein
MFKKFFESCKVEEILSCLFSKPIGIVKSFFDHLHRIYEKFYNWIFEKILIASFLKVFFEYLS